MYCGVPCRKIFKTKSDYFSHIRNKKHKLNFKSETKFPCDMCNMVFRHSSSLSRHKLKTHRNKDSPNDVEDVIVKDASFITDLKNKIVDDKEDKEDDLSSVNDQRGAIDKALEETAPEVDLSSSTYFLSHPSMIKQFKNKTKHAEMINEDSNLPRGWFSMDTIRKGIIRRNGATVKNRQFITPDRKVIRSVEGMMEYMKVSNNYSKAEIETVSKYFKFRKSSL